MKKNIINYREYVQREKGCAERDLNSINPMTLQYYFKIV